MPINILGSDLWSILLNGATPDSLTVTTNTANSALGDSGSNFTIEGWFYLNYANPPTALPTILISNYTDWNSGYNNRWALILVANTGYIGWMNHLGYLACQDTQTRFNQWVHIAVVRNGSTITLYINGTSIGTQTTNQNYSSSGTIKIAGNIPNTNNSGSCSNYTKLYLGDNNIINLILTWALILGFVFQSSDDFLDRESDSINSKPNICNIMSVEDSIKLLSKCTLFCRVMFEYIYKNTRLYWPDLVFDVKCINEIINLIESRYQS